MMAPPRKGFIEENIPRHTASEALRDLIAARPEDTAKALIEYNGVFATTAPPPAPRDLLDTYTRGDYRGLWLDAELRPLHYDDRQHAIIDHLFRKSTLKQPATTAERTELMLTWMRTTRTPDQRDAKRRQSDKRHEEEEDAEIMLEDGRTLGESKGDQPYEPTFEKQDFGDRIIV